MYRLLDLHSVYRDALHFSIYCCSVIIVASNAFWALFANDSEAEHKLPYVT
jgi:hypothetical protein